MIFLESPIPVIVLGILAEAALGWLWLNTRQRSYLVAMLGVLALTGIGVLVERLVVTERERVEATIDAAAAAVEANDLAAVERLVSPSNPELLQRIRYFMNRVEFFQVKIRNVEVSINELTSPPTAEVNFDGVANFRDRMGEFPYHNYPHTFRIEMVKEPSGWKILQEEGDPQRPLSRE